MQFEVYADSGDNHRWRLIASNGQNVASSGESFASKSNAKRAAQNVKDNADKAWPLSSMRFVVHYYAYCDDFAEPGGRADVSISDCRHRARRPPQALRSRAVLDSGERRTSNACVDRRCGST